MAAVTIPDNGARRRRPPCMERLSTPQASGRNRCAPGTGRVSDGGARDAGAAQPRRGSHLPEHRSRQARRSRRRDRDGQRADLRPRLLPLGIVRRTRHLASRRPSAPRPPTERASRSSTVSVPPTEAAITRALASTSPARVASTRRPIPASGSISRAISGVARWRWAPRPAPTSTASPIPEGAAARRVPAACYAPTADRPLVRAVVGRVRRMVQQVMHDIAGERTVGILREHDPGFRLGVVEPPQVEQGLDDVPFELGSVRAVGKST